MRLPEKTHGDYRSLLRDEHEVRRAKNLRYSQSAFARAIGLPPNQYSEILRGRRGLSAQKALSIAQKLGLSKTQSEIFCDLVAVSHGRSFTEKMEARQRLEASRRDIHYRSIEMESFKFISDWFHLAILELMKVEGFVPSPLWIAEQFELPVLRVKQAFHRLQVLGFIKKQNQRWKLTSQNNFLVGGTPAESIKKAHHQLLQRAMKALFTQSLDRREFVSLTVAISPKQIPLVKKRIREFWSALDKELNDESTKTTVYHLGIQFFNLCTGERNA